jgi:hypothetical protein
MAHRPAFPEVLFERDHADVGRGVLGGKFEGEGGRVVFGAVVDDEELMRACASWVSTGRCGGTEVCEGGVKHDGETRRFVVGGNDDAQVERAIVGEGRERDGCRWRRARAVGLFRRPGHDGGRREEDEG